MEKLAFSYTSLKDYVTPQQLADLVVFVASPRGRLISGQALSVCGDTQMLLAVSPVDLGSIAGAARDLQFHRRTQAGRRRVPDAVDASRRESTRRWRDADHRSIAGVLLVGSHQMQRIHWTDAERTSNMLLHLPCGGHMTISSLQVEHGSAIAVGVLGTRVVDRVDGGRKLMIEAQIAIVGTDGQLRAGLTDSAFSMPSLECGWGDCGVWLPDGSASFGVGEARTAEPGSVSASMAGFDPTGSRRTGGKRFLSAVFSRVSRHRGAGLVADASPLGRARARASR